VKFLLQLILGGNDGPQSSVDGGPRDRRDRVGSAGYRRGDHPLDELMEIVLRPDVEFTTKLTPIDSITHFMARTGNYKNKPTSATSCLFPEAF